MTHQVLVSVIVPAFNVAQHVASALQSVMQQTEPNFEIIVVDDCSTDDTAAIAANIARSDERVRLIELPENLGPGSARNIALKAATGLWVAVLDADDRYGPLRLERLLNLAARTGADIVSDNIVACPENGTGPEHILFSRSRIPREMQLTATEFFVQNINSTDRSDFGFMKPIFRREFLLKNDLAYNTRTRFGEDFMFSVSCLMQGATWWITPEPFYYYTIRRGSLAYTATVDDLRVIAAMEQRLLDRIPSSNSRDLSATIRRHKKIIDGLCHTSSFKSALKRRSYRKAFDVLFESRSSLQSIMNGLITYMPRKVCQHYRERSQ
jgi:succinoglycan biosynthesis protein ExoO